MRAKKRTRFASVWDAIESSPQVAAGLALRAGVASAVIEEIRRRRLTQAAAAAACGVTQPRISDLMRGRLDLFSLDSLIDLAAHLDLHASINLSRPSARWQQRNAKAIESYAENVGVRGSIGDSRRSI
jgi:predicted XRE-type DNA-binding protein